jgi:nitrite reductase/ring-hydroxylating ferredoxin subunit
MSEVRIGPASDLPSGTLIGVGHHAVGNADGKLFAVSRRCRHLGANLANGSIDSDGCLVCPWHASKCDVETGRMVLRSAPAPLDGQVRDRRTLVA